MGRSSCHIPRGEIQGGGIRRSHLLVVRRGIVKGEPIERFPFHCAFGSFCHTTKGTYILPPRYVLQRDGLPRRADARLAGPTSSGGVCRSHFLWASAMTSMVGSSCNACHRERPTGAWRSVPHAGSRTTVVTPNVQKLRKRRKIQIFPIWMEHEFLRAKCTEIAAEH